MLEHQTAPEAQADAAAWLEWAAQGEVLEAAELLKKLIDRADPWGEQGDGPPD
jgi:predicted transcriptional regulator